MIDGSKYYQPSRRVSGAQAIALTIYAETQSKLVQRANPGECSEAGWYAAVGP
jgi:hypothetical protein